MNDPLRIGILGTGFIAQEFAAALAGAEGIQVVAVASRELATATAFATRFHLPRAFADYGALVADQAVDAVYVALPNSLHAEWSIRAAGNGKHVLCEKPLAPTLEEAQRMFAAAERHGVALLEAFPYYFQPQTIELVRRITAGEIGAVRSVHAALGFSLSRPDSIRLDQSLAGGALLDAGCYPVSLARLLIGAPPVSVQAWSERGTAAVDVTTVATLRYPSGAFAQVSCSIATGLHRFAVVAGAAGMAETAYSNHTDVDRPAVFRIKHGTDWSRQYENIETGSGSGFVLEARAFARMCGGGGDTAHLKRLSLDNAATLVAIARSAATDQPVSVGL